MLCAIERVRATKSRNIVGDGWIEAYKDCIDKKNIQKKILKEKAAS